MTSPAIDKSKALNQNGPKKDLPKVKFSSPTLHQIKPILSRQPLFIFYLCVRRWAAELILPFLVVGLAFTAGLAAFMPVIP